MYQALLTRKYLTSKVMPLLSALAIALSTAMVLTVWSVMGGFLVLLLESGKTTIGDVAIEVSPPRGIPFYGELVDRLTDHPDVASATPVIETPGMVAFSADQRRLVQVVGIEPETFDEVTGYESLLWWRPLDGPIEGDDSGVDIRHDEAWESTMRRALEAGLALREFSPETNASVPAAVPGIEMSRANRRTPTGVYEPTWMLGIQEELTLSVLPLSQKGSAIDVDTRTLPIANEFRTGLYETDANQVFVPLALIQEMMNLTAGRRVVESQEFNEVVVDPETGEERFAPLEFAREIPAKVTSIRIKAAPGVTADELDTVAESIYWQHHVAHPEDVYAPDGESAEAVWREFFVYTWDQKPGLRTYIAAVQKEIGLVLILFAFISLTAVFLVLAIFWSMISEKTKDIGILRAVGASKWGVAWLFIRYGLAIGVVGSVAGVALAHAVVWNINSIHEWLGSTLGIVVWDPATYYFTQIPSDVDPARAAMVFVAGILASAFGALIPAWRGGSLDPVKALRFE